jgi:hypothetical protein
MTSSSSFPMTTAAFHTILETMHPTTATDHITANQPKLSDAQEVLNVSLKKAGDMPDVTGLIPEPHLVHLRCVRRSFRMEWFKTVYNFDQGAIDDVESRTESFKSDFPKIIPLLNDAGWEEISLTQSYHSFKVHAKAVDDERLLVKPGELYRTSEWEHIFGRGGKLGFAVLTMQQGHSLYDGCK